MIFLNKNFTFRIFSKKISRIHFSAPLQWLCAVGPPEKVSNFLTAALTVSACPWLFVSGVDNLLHVVFFNKDSHDNYVPYRCLRFASFGFLFAVHYIFQEYMHALMIRTIQYYTIYCHRRLENLRLFIREMLMV